MFHLKRALSQGLAWMPGAMGTFRERPSVRSQREGARKIGGLHRAKLRDGGQWKSRGEVPVGEYGKVSLAQDPNWIVTAAHSRATSRPQQSGSGRGPMQADAGVNLGQMSCPGFPRDSQTHHTETRGPQGRRKLALKKHPTLRSRPKSSSQCWMVGVRGFEPPTSASRTQRSTKLSHTPTGAGNLEG
jgi:hypothetical protein